MGQPDLAVGYYVRDAAHAGEVFEVSAAGPRRAGNIPSPTHGNAQGT